MALFTTGLQLGRTLKGAGRLRTIAGVFAKHGFQNVLEKARLGRYVMKKLTETDPEQFTPAERMRMAFEELGPTFVKFGQLLATRADIVPEDFIVEFKKLHDSVEPESYSAIKNILQEHFKTDLNKIFIRFDENPIGSASIAQVHRATLIDGSEVVVKVQRPHIERIIRDDLTVLFTMSGLLEKYVPESRPLNPVAMVEEFFKALELETDFRVEANNMRRFQKNFLTNPAIKIPDVYLNLSGQKVLVMEFLDGLPLSHPQALQQEGTNTEKLVREGLIAFFRSVFQHGFFHGDLHAGNLIILPNNQLGLIDFGVVGRLSRKTQDSVAGMFMALASEDYEQLAFEYVEMAPYSDLVDLNEFAQNLREIISPHFGLTFRDVNVGKLMMSSAHVAAKHKLRLPSELMILFKSLVTIEGMGRLIVEDFDVLTYSLEFAGELIKTKYDPSKVAKDLARLTKESSSLIYTLPRQLKLLLRRMTSPDYAWKLEVEQLEELKRSIETSSNIVFLGLLIGSLILGSSLSLFLKDTHMIAEVPTFSAIGFSLAFILSLVAFYNYIRK
ncbi:MAG: ABC1 kinase family protein [Bdellovibrionales bacterium]